MKSAYAWQGAHRGGICLRCQRLGAHRQFCATNSLAFLWRHLFQPKPIHAVLAKADPNAPAKEKQYRHQVCVVCTKLVCARLICVLGTIHSLRMSAGNCMDRHSALECL